MHLTDIFQAYFDCRCRKRRTSEALQFEEHYEKNCLKLYHEVIAGTYKPDNYKLIYVTDPVMREIFVPTFRDRVVHHLLANWLRPTLEALFIHDNYAGREGKGTLFGIRRAERFMRRVTYNYQKPAFVLKLDIASYFRSIPKDILWGNLQKILFPSSQPSPEFIEGRESLSVLWRMESIPDVPLCTFYAKSTKSIQGTKTRYVPGSSESLFASRSNSLSLKNPYLESDLRGNSEERERELIDLLKSVIFHDPRTHFSGEIDTHFPHYKSLFSAPGERGLPLGDLVSQLLGNFYLHELDHFVKHSLHIKQYGRYMDDMIFFHPDKEVLEQVILQVRVFLRDTMGLTLHEGKIVLNTCEQGISFLGAYIKPWRTYIGNRTKKNMFADVHSGILPNQPTYQSYLGLTGHFDTYRLQKMYRDAVIIIGL